MSRFKNYLAILWCTENNLSGASFAVDALVRRFRHLCLAHPRPISNLKISKPGSALLKARSKKGPKVPSDPISHLVRKRRQRDFLLTWKKLVGDLVKFLIFS